MSRIRRSIFAIVTVAASVALTLVAVGAVRWSLTPVSLPPVVMRPIEPFVGRGGLGTPDSPAVIAGLPESYGYRRTSNGLYVWSPGSGQAQRGDFAWVRGPEFRGSPDAIRVLVLGGSVAYGTGANGDQRWFVIAEQYLTCRLGRPVVLLPLACGAWTTAQERLALELWGWDATPHAVVMVNGFNDSYAACEGARPGDPVFQGLDYAAFYGSVKHAGGMASMSVVQRVAARDELAAHAARMAKSREYAVAVADAYRRNVNAMVRRCDLEGIPALAVLQPARVDLDVKSLNAMDALAAACYAEIRRDPPVRLIDARTSVVLSDFSYLGDGCHFDAHGHQRFGVWLGSQLAPLFEGQ